jgi:hypothetical protein
MRKRTPNKTQPAENKSIVDLIRQEKEACANRIRTYTGKLLEQFQQQLGAANETYQSLVQDCGFSREEFVGLEVVREFVSNLGQTSRPVSSARRARATGSDRRRVGTADLEGAILNAIGTGSVAHAAIKKSAPVVGLYRRMGKTVPNLFIKLHEMTREKQLVKSGSGKNATYRAA